MAIKLEEEKKKMKKKSLLSMLILSLLAGFLLVGCVDSKPAGDDDKGKDPVVATSEVDKIIAEAQGMSMEELAKKAIEESNGKTFFGVGNSSRGKTAIPLFIEYLHNE